MTTTTTGVKVGDFFYASWGYDQTNVDFYKVVGFSPSGKSVRLQRWSQTLSGSQPPCDYVVPGDGPAQVRVWDKCEECAQPGYTPHQCPSHLEDAPVVTKRLQSYGPSDEPTYYVAHHGASLWDGKPKYQTSFGWGH